MQFKIVRHRDQQGIYHEGNTVQLLRRVREVTPDSQKAAGGRQVRPRGTRTSCCPTRALTPGERRRERDRMTSQLRHAAPLNSSPASGCSSSTGAKRLMTKEIDMRYWTFNTNTCVAGTEFECELFE